MLEEVESREQAGCCTVFLPIVTSECLVIHFSISPHTVAVACDCCFKVWGMAVSL